MALGCGTPWFDSRRIEWCRMKAYELEERLENLKLKRRNPSWAAFAYNGDINSLALIPGYSGWIPSSQTSREFDCWAADIFPFCQSEMSKGEWVKTEVGVKSPLFFVKFLPGGFVREMPTCKSRLVDGVWCMSGHYIVTCFSTDRLYQQYWFAKGKSENFAVEYVDDDIYPSSIFHVSKRGFLGSILGGTLGYA